MRKLASIQRILSLDPIQGADKIEKARVLGWQCVVLKGEFSVGDLGVFFEIDSLLNHEKAWSQVLSARRYRVKTIKLKGIISQGLMLPLWKIPEVEAWFRANALPLEEGHDVTELLQVEQYDPFPDKGSPGRIIDPAALFPHFIPKTEAVRIQSAPALLTELVATNGFMITEKLDGQSMTVWRREGKVGVASRKYTVSPDHPMHIHAMSTGLFDKIPWDFAVQGEYVGPGAHGNPMGLPKNYFYVFDVWDINQQKYVDSEDMFPLLQRWDIATVPLVGNVLACKGQPFLEIDYWLKRAAMPSEGKSKPREGIVVRPRKETYSPILGDRLKFKVIHPEYLLGEN